MKIISDITEMESLKSSWEALWQNDNWSTPFNHPDWILSYAKAFPYQNYFIVETRKEQFTCVWPLQKINQTFFFIGDPQADYSRPSVSNDISSEAAIQILLNGLDQLSFESLFLREWQQGDPLIAALHKYARQCGYHTLIEKGFPCPRMVQESGSDIFYQKFVKSKNQKRVLNVLKRNGNLEFKTLSKESDIQKHLTSFFLMHTCRWDTVGETVFMDSAMRQFYTNLTQSLPQALIHFSLLKQDDNIIAMNYDFVHKKSLYWYKAAFNNQLNNQSPGLGLLCYIGREINDKGFQILDFTRGTETWKLRFANDVAYTSNTYITRKKRQVYQHQLKAAMHRILSNLSKKEQIKNRIILLNRAVAKYGKFGLISHILQKTRQRYFTNPEMVIMERCKTDMPPKPMKQLDTLHFIEGTYDHVFEIADLLNPINKVHYVKDLIHRLDAGYHVFLGYIKKDLAYALWVTTQETKVYVEEINNELSLKPGAAYLIDGFTSPNYRGYGIHTLGLDYVARQALNMENCTHVVGLALADNTPSIRGFEKSGYKYKGRIARHAVTY